MEKKGNATPSANSPVKVTKSEVTRVVKNYFKQKFKNPIISENEGLVRIQGDMELGLFREDKIFIGKLDNDETPDAIITYGYQATGAMAFDRHITSPKELNVPPCASCQGFDPFKAYR